MHEPVLLETVLQYLDPQARESYLDLTAGYGGHAQAILDRTGSLTQSVLVDRDEQAVTALHAKFPEGPVVRWQDFLTASQELHKEQKQFDLILADLGVSSPHLNQAERGFSINQDGPLDMRMDRRQALTAEIVVNTYDEAVLADLLRTYGEEPKARQIASSIVAARPLQSTQQLATLVAQVWSKGKSRVHPATRTFQALRIVVNDELGLLEQALPIWLELLAPGGRIAVISFQSLEDRIVKQFFADKAGNRYDAELQLLTKRPVTAGETELVFNPRARSAKLRAAAKINNKEREH